MSILEFNKEYIENIGVLSKPKCREHKNTECACVVKELFKSEKKVFNIEKFSQTLFPNSSCCDAFLKFDDGTFILVEFKSSTYYYEKDKHVIDTKTYRKYDSSKRVLETYSEEIKNKDIHYYYLFSKESTQKYKSIDKTIREQFRNFGITLITFSVSDRDRTNEFIKKIIEPHLNSNQNYQYIIKDLKS